MSVELENKWKIIWNSLATKSIQCSVIHPEGTINIGFIKENINILVNFFFDDEYDIIDKQ